MTKLSKAQLAILRRMGEGEHMGIWTKGIRRDTVWRLQNKGLVEDVGPAWAGGDYRITPAGLAYLEGHDD